MLKNWKRQSQESTFGSGYPQAAELRSKDDISTWVSIREAEHSSLTASCFGMWRQNVRFWRGLRVKPLTVRAVICVIPAIATPVGNYRVLRMHVIKQVEHCVLWLCKGLLQRCPWTSPLQPTTSFSLYTSGEHQQTTQIATLCTGTVNSYT